MIWPHAIMPERERERLMGKVFPSFSHTLSHTHTQTLTKERFDLHCKRTAGLILCNRYDLQ